MKSSAAGAAVRGARVNIRGAKAGPIVAETVVAPGLRAGEWQVFRPPASSLVPSPAAEDATVFPTLEAAVRSLRADERFALALPLEHGLIQRLELPEAPAVELDAMARIQLEKVLPYAGDALGLRGEIVPRLPANGAAPGEPEEQPAVAASALAIFSVQAVPHERMEPFGEPLAAIGRWPERVSLHIALIAGTVPEARQSSYEPGTEGCALLLTREAGRTIVGILERGRLVFAQSLLPVGDDPDRADEAEPGAVGNLAAVAALERELPSLLLGAELEGVPTGFQRVWLDSRLAGWQRAVEQSVRLPVALLPALPPAVTILPPAAIGDLSPPGWARARQRQLRAARLRQRLKWAAGIYVGLIVLALADLAWLRWRGRQIDRDVAASVPRVERIRAARARWNALAPAVDQRQSVVEMLEQIRQSLPPGDVRLTLLDLSRLRNPATLTIEGEAPNYATAVELNEKLQARPELRGFRFASEPPANLPNGRARFRISATLP